MKLQVFKDNKWHYVFCRNVTQGIITTKVRKKALPGHALDYFRSKFANDIFRISKGC